MQTPNITEFEYLVVAGDGITVDLLVWRRYKQALAGTRLVETLMDLNPHLAHLHKLGPFLPPGTRVRIPIDRDLLKRAAKPVKTVTLTGRV